jgi:hypothetical protein
MFFVTLALSLLGCSPETPVSQNFRRLVLAGESGLSDFGPGEEIVIAVLGQSNACGSVPRTPGFTPSLVNEHLGATIYRNGVLLTEYGAPPPSSPVVGPEPYVVDELMILGFSPTDITVVTRCVSGSALTAQKDTIAPNLISDVNSLDLPDPFGILFWQGEADARVDTLAAAYESKLTGSNGKASLRSLIEDEWPAIRWAIVELRVRDPDYAPVPNQELVRSAQHAFGAWPGVCVVPSFDAPLMNGDNQPHTNLDGTEIVARRAVHGWFDPSCP